jgi:hypothetical protein
MLSHLDYCLTYGLLFRDGQGGQKLAVYLLFVAGAAAVCTCLYY